MSNSSGPRPKPKRKAKRALTPALRRLLVAVFVAFSLLSVNAIYLVAVRVAEWSTGAIYQDYFYQLMFLGHLALGLLIIAPTIYYCVAHMRRTYDRKTRRIVNVGYGLFGAVLVLIISGVLLTRLGPVVLVKSAGGRAVAFWAHVLAPLVIAWLYALHRLSGPKIRWRVGAAVAAAGGIVALGLFWFQSQDPRQWGVVGPASGEQYFFPSLTRTATGNFIPADVLMNDAYCAECHEDVHAGWQHSAHRFSSFNNPFYRFSVRETREVAMKRDGNVQASRFCAGCHDPVPFLSGAFDDPNFDDVNHPTAAAGITCTVCHSISAVNSPRGNADYTVEEPVHYPFAFSDNAALRWVNRAMIKAKPGLHKKTFLKPLHKTPEFCGTCHKVHLPKELNEYKFLRGQNHYDSYLLSGVSGHGVRSFYYPEEAEPDCNGCHMPLAESSDFGAQDYDERGATTVHDHLFPSANTAIAHVLNLPSTVVDRHKEYLDGVLEVDIFGIREGSELDAAVIGPLRPKVPALKPGHSYVLEVVLRTMRMGHHFTQGTADSNQVWVDLTAKSGDTIVGRSGGMTPDGILDPWSYMVNAYVLDRDANRIDRRNAQDIFVALYNHQIPPGAASVVHYLFTVPEDATGTFDIEVAAKYRKFDTKYLRYVFGDERPNDLPTAVLGRDHISFPVSSSGEPQEDQPPVKKAEWMRWNDYGIGSLRQFVAGADDTPLYDAVGAFKEVEKLGRADGPLNLTVAYLRLKYLEEAVKALDNLAEMESPGPPWRLTYLQGRVNMETGHFDRAITSFESLLKPTAETKRRGFDFTKDYRLLNELGIAYRDHSKQYRGKAKRAQRDELTRKAISYFEAALVIDPENVQAHHNLGVLYKGIGETAKGDEHTAKRDEYKVDEGARSQAVSRHRQKNEAARHASHNSVLYDLQRKGAYGLPEAAVVDREADAEAGSEATPEDEQEDER